MVITIIILLILAGTALNSILGNENVINKAKKAKEQNNISIVKEQIKLEMQNVLLEKYNGETLYLYDYVNELIKRVVLFDTLDETNTSIKVLADKGYIFNITRNLDVIYVGKTEGNLFLKEIDKGLYIEDIKCFQGNDYLRFSIYVASDADIKSIEYSICKQGEDNWQTGSSDSLAFKISGLEVNTSYRFKVKIQSDKRTIESNEYIYTTKQNDRDAYISIKSQNDLVIKPEISKGFGDIKVAKWSEGEKDKEYFRTSGNTFDANSTFTISNKNSIHTIYVKNDVGNETIFSFMPDYTITFNNTGTGNEGDYQEYEIPFTGNYKIECYGAGGSNGNYYATVGKAIGGVGAHITGEFDLKRNDKLIMIVGQQGSISPEAVAADGVAGGGGGGTFVTKQTGEETPYQITAKNNEYVTPLIVAAGGNSGNDVFQQKNVINGLNGGPADKAYSNGGFTKFLTSPNGVTYARNNQTATGGYGGATASDDSCGVGGGWELGNSTSSSKSYNAGKNILNSVASSNKHGKVIITKIDYQVSEENISNKEANFIFSCKEGNFDDLTMKLELIIDYQVEDGYKKQYAIGNGSWIDYTGPITITSNCTVKARTVDISTNEIKTSTKEIRNIDTLQPQINLSQISEKFGYNVSVTSLATVDEMKWDFGKRDESYFSSQGNIIDSSKQFDTGESWGYITVYVKTTSGREAVKTAEVTKSLNATGTGATGSYQEITIPSTGQYKISAYGAQGGNGNKYNGTAPTGGKGAYVYGTFSLNKGDKLIVLVGQQGTISPESVSADGAAGAGGGGTFVAKVVSSSSYLLTAKNVYVSPLIVAAGGNGGNDGYYQKKITNGAGGIHTNGSSSDGFTKFLSSPDGAKYSRGNQTANGGYGGGLAADDSCSRRWRMDVRYS